MWSTKIIQDVVQTHKFRQVGLYQQYQGTFDNILLCLQENLSDQTFFKTYAWVIIKTLEMAVPYIEAGIKAFDLKYHVVLHTENTVLVAIRTAKLNGLSDRGILLAAVAAILHDVGYAATYNGHELIGAHYAVRFMREGFPGKERVFSSDEVDQVYNIIKNSVLRNQNISDLPTAIQFYADMVILDAKFCDFYLFQEDYRREALRVRTCIDHNWALKSEQDYRKWVEFQIKFLNFVKYPLFLKRLYENLEKNIARLTWMMQLPDRDLQLEHQRLIQGCHRALFHV